jgi:hypothetical protein
MKNRLLFTLLVISDRSELYELGIRPCGKRIPNVLNDLSGRMAPEDGCLTDAYTLQDMG